MKTGLSGFVNSPGRVFIELYRNIKPSEMMTPE